MKQLLTASTYLIVVALLTSWSQAIAQSWISDADGTWSDPLNWLGGNPPDAPDATADFSTVDIGSNRIVTLDSSRSVGHLVFGDLLEIQNWTIATNGSADATLTLVTTTGTPSITVLNNGVTNRLSMAGTQGFVKLGPGWLTLQGATNVFSGATVVSNGTLFLAKAAGAMTIPGDLEIHSGATVQFTTASNQIADTSMVTILGGTLNLANRPELIRKLVLRDGVVTNTSGSAQLHVTEGFEVHAGAVHSILGGAGQILTKLGPGTVVLTGANTYNGGTVIQEGTLQIGDGGTSGTAGASGTAITNDSLLVFDRGSGTALTVSGIVSGEGSITKTGSGSVTLSGENTYTGSTVINAGVLSLNSSSTFGDGTGTVVLSGGTFNTTANRSATAAPVPNPIHLAADSTIATASSSTTVDLHLSGPLSGTTGTLTFRNDGANAATDQFEPRLSAGFQFDRPIAIDNGPVGTTRLNCFNAAGTTQIFSGPISGNGSVRKSVGSGSGGVTIFAGTNSYSGATTVNAGELQINGILGTNVVAVGSGGTLAGTGTLLGAVQVQSGGTLAPGVATGTVTISNTLALASGSTTLMDLDSGGACDRVAGLSSVSFGGTLQLNITGTLSGGQSFQLFQSAAYGGSFGNIVPATPGPGMEWNTNNLVVNGTLSVVSTNAANAPTLSDALRTPDRNVQFSIAGAQGLNYRVWATTNLAASDGWTVLTNSTFESSAAVFSDGQATNHLQRFYRVTIP